MQAGKSLIAALIAWQLCALWLPGQPAYLAVASALLMVNAKTVYRSVTQASRSVATRVAGVALALSITWMLGSTTSTIIAIVGIALVAGWRSSDDGLQVASTAVLTLAATAASPAGSVVLTTIAALVGATVGMTVNALVLPPVHVRESDEAVRDLARAMGGLLKDMGSGLRAQQHADLSHAWLQEGQGLQQRVANVQDEVQQAQESLRWNTRCSVHSQARPLTYESVTDALDGMSLQVCTIVRTLADNVSDTHADNQLGQPFRIRYAEMLELAGQAVEAFGDLDDAARSTEGDACNRLREAVGRSLEWHESMTDLIARGALIKPGAWHTYGSLMTAVERLLADLDHAHTH